MAPTTLPVKPRRIPIIETSQGRVIKIKTNYYKEDTVNVGMAIGGACRQGEETLLVNNKFTVATTDGRAPYWEPVTPTMIQSRLSKSAEV
jgi:hypothetical protein